MSLSFSKKRSSSSICGRQLDNRSVTSSGATPRDGKSAAYRNPRYEIQLASAGIYMTNIEGEVTTDACKDLCKTLLYTEQPVPQVSLFNDDVFERICQSVQNRNETRVIRDLSPLLIPSAEMLYIQGATYLKHLIENVNEAWKKSIPLAGPRPQSDFSVGVKSSAFTSDQLKRLKPFVGDWQTTSRIMATDEMYFPFLTSEVKCGNEALNVADRQNAHSASVAANAVVEVYRAISRQEELHRKIVTIPLSPRLIYTAVK